jgi:DNA-binding NtrC family response regulator
MSASLCVRSDLWVPPVTRLRVPIVADILKGNAAVARKLLIIDDEIGITKVVGLIAARVGMEYRALNTSPTAIEVFREYRPDIVIIDMIMPDKDGIEVLNEIMLTGIPTQIVLTSGLSEGYLRLAKGVAKFHGDERVRFLNKPFRRDELVALLSDMTDVG